MPAILLTAAVGLGAAAPAGAAQGSAQHAGQLQQEADAIHAAGAPGVLVSVTTPNGRQTVRAGVADTATGAPVPLDARFRIGSATKSFVATVVLQLVGEGRLELSDTVDRWLPGVVTGNGNDGSRITVRALLQHTSGIYDFAHDLPEIATAAGYQSGRFDVYTPAQLVALAMKHQPTFPPGTGTSYSNTNYVLLGMIVNRVTGQTWAHEVDARIIRPLGLRHTLVPGTLPFIPGPHAEGYSTFGGTDPVDVTVLNPSMIDAAGSIISTTADLSRFYAALTDGRLLAPAQLTNMETTIPAAQLSVFWPSARYGLGLAWFPLSCGGGYFGHPGGVPGYQTWDATAPETGRTVVVSSTGDGSEAIQLATNALVDNEMCRAG
ncbi:serine hydrolase domain-containing protein [Catenulispora rubra]|uniref:serine hydrolase domain-containing protein n=1 Tax=Catenulispora rubra TaxID=280293 RepID=UPI002B2768A1|nr:serine hydrolase domain-containing protein [Catenulispora rubra]